MDSWGEKNQSSQPFPLVHALKRTFFFFLSQDGDVNSSYCLETLSQQPAQEESELLLWFHAKRVNDILLPTRVRTQRECDGCLWAWPPWDWGGKMWPGQWHLLHSKKRNEGVRHSSIISEYNARSSPRVSDTSTRRPLAVSSWPELYNSLLTVSFPCPSGDLALLFHPLLNAHQSPELSLCSSAGWSRCSAGQPWLLFPAGLTAA